jgi:HK97 family phage major capsid protein
MNEEFNKPAEEKHVDPSKGKAERKTLGELIVGHKGLFRPDGLGRVLAQKNNEVDIDIDLKADFFTSAGWAPQSLRDPGYVPYPTRQLQVIDYWPVLPTNQASIKYMLETTFTNSAAEAAEGAAAAESALALTETSQPVEKIATFIPTSEEQLEDVEGAAAYLNNRLGYMVRARLDSQLLNGNGTPPNLKGTLNIGGSLQTQAKGTDPTPDAIHKAFTLVRHTGFAEPTVLYSHPDDWQDVVLLRTADGIYIFGGPMAPNPNVIWGVPVCVTTAVVANTMITGDYRQFADFRLRRGLQIEMSNGYTDYFVKGKFAVKATIRGAAVHYRTSAFCKITGV